MALMLVQFTSTSTHMAGLSFIIARGYNKSRKLNFRAVSTFLDLYFKEFFFEKSAFLFGFKLTF